MLKINQTALQFESKTAAAGPMRLLVSHKTTNQHGTTVFVVVTRGYNSRAPRGTLEALGPLPGVPNNKNTINVFYFCDWYMCVCMLYDPSRVISVVVALPVCGSIESVLLQLHSLNFPELHAVFAAVEMCG